MSAAAISFQENSIKFPLQAAASPSEMRLLIQDVARRCLMELALSLVIGTIAASFTATPLHAALIFAAIVVQTVANAALRTADALAAKMPPCQETQWIRSASPYLCMNMFAYMTAGNAQSLLHESGHAIAAKWCFKNANPQITLTPCLGGVTQFSTTHLSALGEKLGKSNALLLVTLMGPSCSLLISTAVIAVGYAVRNKLPELGVYLIGVGRGDFYVHSYYALTALTSMPSSQAHDFIRLRSYGIHPLAAAMAILAIPFLIDQALKKNEPQ